MGSSVCAAFGLCLHQVVGYAEWSCTFWSCDLGRNGGDSLLVAYCHFYWKNPAKSWRYAHDDVISLININKYKMVEQ